MKRLFIIAILFTITALSAIALSDNALFIRANDLYAEKEFDKALDNYNELIERGVKNANLYYNIGNCHFRKNRLGPAILNFKRALRIDSSHKQANNNLKFALSLTKDKQEDASDGFIGSIWARLFSFFNINRASMLSLILFLSIIGMIIFILLKFRNREKSVPVFILTILIFIFTLSFIITVSRINSYNSHKPAVLMSDSAIGHSGPGEDFSRVFTIHEGMNLTLEEFQNDWALVKLPNGLGGWIPNDTYLKVNP